MGTIEDRNSKDLEEAEEIKKGGGVPRIHRRTAQKGLNDPDKHDGVITHQTFWSMKSSGP